MAEAEEAGSSSSCCRCWPFRRRAAADLTEPLTRADGEPFAPGGDLGLTPHTKGVPLDEKYLLPALEKIIVEEFGGKKKGKGLFSKVKSIFSA